LFWRRGRLSPLDRPFLFGRLDNVKDATLRSSFSIPVSAVTFEVRRLTSKSGGTPETLAQAIVALQAIDAVGLGARLR
jgi:hypothetical protein